MFGNRLPEPARKCVGVAFWPVVEIGDRWPVTDRPLERRMTRGGGDDQRLVYAPAVELVEHVGDQRPAGDRGEAAAAVGVYQRVPKPVHKEATDKPGRCYRTAKEPDSRRS